MKKHQPGCCFMLGVHSRACIGECRKCAEHENTPLRMCFRVWRALESAGGRRTNIGRRCVVGHEGFLPLEMSNGRGHGGGGCKGFHHSKRETEGVILLCISKVKYKLNNLKYEPVLGDGHDSPPPTIVILPSCAPPSSVVVSSSCCRVVVVLLLVVGDDVAR